MGAVSDEIKKIPAWAWLAIGLITVGVIVMVRRANSTNAAAAGNSANTGPLSSSGALGSTDPGTVGTMQLGELSNIEQQLTGIANANQNQQTTFDLISNAYQKDLGRTGSPGEINYWLTQVPGLGIAQVIGDIQGSPEAAVHAAYETYLGRNDANDPGAQGWIQQASQGPGMLNQTVNQIANSPEAIAYRNSQTAVTAAGGTTRPST